MVDLALHNDDGPVLYRAIAARQAVSTKYLCRLFVKLKRAGLVHSVKGPGGGYLLALGVTHHTTTAYHVAEESVPCGCNDPFGGIHRVLRTDGTVEAVNEIDKYGGICVLPRFDAAQIASLMTLRLNIYTDPQRPMKTEEGVYPINDPGPEAPVLVKAAQKSACT